MPRTKAILKWLGLGLGGFLTIVVAAGGIGYAWLQGDHGRAWLTRQVEAAATTPGEIELTIGALEGSLPENLLARDIVLRDADGIWLTVATLEIDWRPWRLLDRTLDIEALTATAVDLARLPARPAQSGDDDGGEATAGDLLDFPFKIRVGRLAVDEIALGEAVLGQAARFTLAGEAARREDGAVSTSLDLRRIDGIEGRLSAKLNFDVASDTLTAEVDAASAPDGLIATLLDIPDLPRAELRLTGSGPLATWEGRFALSLGDVLSAEAAIGLQRGAGSDIAFRLDGHAETELPGSDPLLTLIAGRTDIVLEGDWRNDRLLRLERLTAANDSFSLTLSGEVEPASGLLDLKLAAASGKGDKLARLLALDRLGRFSATAAVTGVLNKPKAELELRVEEIASPDFTASSLAVAGSATARSDLLGPAPVLALDLQGELGEPRLPGAEEINRLLGAALPFLLRGDLDLDRATLDIATFEASVEGATIAARGTAKVDDGTAALDTELQVADLTMLQPLTEIRFGGQAALAGPLTVESYGSRLAADLKGRWEQPSSDIPLIASAAGKGMDLTARLAIEGAEVRIEEATARSAVATLKAALTVTPEATLRGGRYSLAVPQASVLAKALGVEVSGPATVDGELSGPFDALDLGGKARLDKLIVEDQPLSAIDATYRLRLSGADIDGPVTVSLSSPLGPVEASSDLSLRSDKLTLANLQAKLPAATVVGAAVVPLDSGDPSARLSAEIADLGPWLQLAELSGSGKGQVELSLNQPGAPAPVVASVELLEAQLVPEAGAAPLRAERITLDLTAQDPALAQEGAVKISVHSLLWNRLALTRLDLDGKGTIGDLGIGLTASGDWVEPFDLRAAGRVTQQQEILGIDLTAAEGHIFGQPLNLREPAKITLAPQATRIEHLEITSGQTRLTADAQLGDGRLEMTAALEALPMTTVDAFWESGLTGMITAEVNLQGSFDDPRGTASLNATGLRPKDSKDLPELALNAAADWQGGRLKVDGRLAGPEVAAASFTATAPLRMAADGSGPEIPDDGPLDGRLQWAGNLTTVLLFVPMPQHRLQGDGVVDVAIAGTAGAPELNGSVTLSKGRYENLETGTVLGDLELSAAVSDDRVTLTSLTASDGDGGKVNGSGSLILDDARQFPLDLAITLDKFHALRRDDVTAIAGGTVKLDGSLAAPRVEGRITTETVEISLLAQLPPSVANLDVIEIKNGVIQEKPKQDTAATAIDAELDIIIDMPRKIFVRGRGLDSEWAGRILIQGPAAEPVISGEINLVRGQMALVGKTFQLREGKVTLPKAKTGEATLDVTAVYKGKDLEVTAHLNGPLTKPELELSSVPDVPRDEIISRVLFNKSAASLSAAEAAQLAIALRELTGGGGGADILGFARRALGVDVLRVETAEGSTPAVEAGKYLTDEIYLGVKQGATAETSGAGVEVELTPNITVESEVTGTGASKSGVRFHWDY